MSDVAALYRIQELELDILERTKRIKAINAQLEDDAELQAAVAEREAAQEETDAAEARVKEVQLEITIVGDKREAAETRLYSGEAQSPKELQDMQMELETHIRRKEVLEEELRIVSRERDERQGRLEEKQAIADEAKAKHDDEAQALLAEKADLKSGASELLAQRKTAVAAAPPALFETYSRMRAPKANRPVAVIRDQVCTICGIEQNSVVVKAINRRQGIVKCQNCGRILIKL